MNENFLSVNLQLQLRGVVSSLHVYASPFCTELEVKEVHVNFYTLSR